MKTKMKISDYSSIQLPYGSIGLYNLTSLSSEPILVHMGPLQPLVLAARATEETFPYQQEKI